MGDEIAGRSLPLTDLRIAALGSTLSLRLAVKLLTDQGALVTRVPTGDPAAVAAGLALADVVLDGLTDGLGAQGVDPGSLVERGRLYCRLRAVPAAFPGPVVRTEWEVAAELGLHRRTPVPSLEPLAISAGFGAMHVALNVAAALVRRDRTGSGAAIEVSQFGSTLMSLERAITRIRDPQFEERARRRLPVNEIFRCGDDRFLPGQANVSTVARSDMRGLGHPEWQDGAVAALERELSAEAAAEWQRRFRATFIERPAIEWEQAIAEEAGAGTLCRTREEWRSLPHASDTRIFEPSPDGGRRVGAAVRVFERPPRPGDPAAVSWPPVDASDLPLAGIRVLDLAVILAGPTCGRLLGELGADVIKIDSPRRTGRPWISPYLWLEVNRTKRSALIDAGTDEGRAALWRLVDTADVFIENFRVGKIDALGFSFEAVATRHPGIVYVSMNAYDYGGEFSGRAGWEPNGQAITGMQTARAVHGRPRPVPVPVNDIGTGTMAAFGAMAALREARRTGRAQQVRASLARTGTFLQTSEYDWGGDGAGIASVALIECDGGVVAVDGDAGRARVIAANQSPEEAVALLRDEGFTAAIARTPGEMTELGWVRRSGLVGDWEHPHWGTMTSSFSRAEATYRQRAGWPAVNPGEQTDDVLAEAGYTVAEIDALVAGGAAARERPVLPEPSGA